MRNFIFVAIFFASACCLADESADIRHVLQRNFEACNNEDIDELMDTFSDETPGKEEFRLESEKLWKENDVHYSLVDLEIIEVQGNYATAWVVQTSYTKDREYSDEREEFYRNGTTLLTKEECVKYKAAFKREKGAWKCYLTLTEPVKYSPEE